MSSRGEIVTVEPWQFPRAMRLPNSAIDPNDLTTNHDVLDLVNSTYAALAHDEIADRGIADAAGRAGPGDAGEWHCRHDEARVR